jgi:hypothetical protein
MVFFPRSARTAILAAADAHDRVPKVIGRNMSNEDMHLD